MNDISDFMSWFVNQVINIFTSCFNLLDSITFGGTSLLNVLITILILIPLLSIVLTLFHNGGSLGYRSGRSERVKEHKRKSR